MKIRKLKVSKLYKFLAVFLSLVITLAGIPISASANSSRTAYLQNLAAGTTADYESVTYGEDWTYEELFSSVGKTVVDEYQYVQPQEEKDIFGELEATVVKFSDGTDEIIYRLPIYDTTSSARGIFNILSYVNLSLEGNGAGTLTAKLWKLGNIGSCNLTMTILYGTCRTTPVQNHHKHLSGITSIGSFVSPTTLTTSISTTKYFSVNLKGTFMDNNIDHRLNNILFNKKAVRYPQYTCPVSNIYCVPPYYTDFAKTASVDWNHTNRTTYITYFNNTYNGGKAPWNWDEYDIHHIRPRNYGGKNEYSNLIPLPRQTHYTFTGWWNNYS